MSTAPNSPDGRSGLSTRQIVAIVLVVLGIVFIVVNRHEVDIRLIIPVIRMPVWVALTITFLIGGGAGFMFGKRKQKKSR